MGSAAVKIKIMPDSPDADLDSLEKELSSKIEEFGGKIAKVEREPIAFGLNAILITFAWQEDADREVLEADLAKIDHVSSVAVIDFRRAFG